MPFITTMIVPILCGRAQFLFQHRVLPLTVEPRRPEFTVLASVWFHHPHWTTVSRFNDRTRSNERCAPSSYAVVNILLCSLDPRELDTYRSWQLCILRIKKRATDQNVEWSSFWDRFVRSPQVNDHCTDLRPDFGCCRNTCRTQSNRWPLSRFRLCCHWVLTNCP